MNFNYRGATLEDKAENALETAKNKILRLIVAYSTGDEETIERILSDAKNLLIAAETVETVKENEGKEDGEAAGTFNCNRVNMQNEIADLERTLKRLVDLLKTEENAVVLNDAARNAFQCFNALLKTSGEENELPF